MAWAAAHIIARTKMTVSAAAKASPDSPASQAGYGFGTFKGVFMPSMLGQAETPADPRKHAELLSLVQRRRRNLIVAHEGEELPLLQQARRIDIGWGGHKGNLGLMLALAFLLNKTRSGPGRTSWSGASCSPKDEILPATKEIDGLLAEARFLARPQVVSHDGNPFTTIKRHSRQADLLFLGLRSICENETLEDYAAYYALV